MDRGSVDRALNMRLVEYLEVDDPSNILMLEDIVRTQTTRNNLKKREEV